MKKALSIILLIMMFLGSAYAAPAKNSKESATTVFTVSPQMSCQNCENKIKSNLRFEKGVSNIVTDLKAQTVTVTYNPAKTDTDKIVKAFRKIGYTATESSAKPSEQESSSCCSQVAKPACCNQSPTE